MVQIFLKYLHSTDSNVLELPTYLVGHELYSLVRNHCGSQDESSFLVLNSMRVDSASSLTLSELDTVYVMVPTLGGMDFQHREGGKTGSGGVLSEAQVFS